MIPTTPVDRRRSPRLERQLPLVLESRNRLGRVVTTEISRHGARIHSRPAYRPGEVVRLANLELLRSAPFRVVRCVEVRDGYHQLGVELLDPNADLWGDAYGS